jgi:hypothetical protein
MSRRLVAVLLAAGTGCVLTTDLDGFTTPPPAAGSDAGPESGAETVVADPEAGTTATEAEAGTDGGAPILFHDDFDRPDGPVGNGWIQGDAARYEIVNDEVPVTGGGFAFQSDYLYRPASPDALDIEASIEFTLRSLPPELPQVHVRVTREKSHCYAVGVPANDSFFWGRCAPQGDFDQMGAQDLSEELAVGKTYRLSIAATGTNPVHLVMKVERAGAGGTFTPIGVAEADDATPKRVAETGMFGISANGDPNYTYDDFLALKATAPSR